MPIPDIIKKAFKVSNETDFLALCQVKKNLADSYFIENPLEIKMSRTKSPDDYSVIRINNRTYLTTPKDSYLGQGVYGRVKLAMCIDNDPPDFNHLYAIKRETTNKKYQQQESKIAQEMGLMVAEKACRDSKTTKKDDKGNVTDKKYYSVLNYLGEDLSNLLKNNTLSTAEKTEVAIQLTLQLREMHKKYVHRDISPKNIVVDLTKKPLKVHLIDFGGSQPNELFDTQKTRLFIGTATYNPGLKKGQNGWDRDDEIYKNNMLLLKDLIGADVFSLKRVISYPYERYSRNYERSLINVEKLKAKHFILRQLLDTTNETAACSRMDTTDKIAAALICYQYDIMLIHPITNEQCQQLIYLYLQEKSKAEIWETLETFYPEATTQLLKRLSPKESTMLYAFYDIDYKRFDSMEYLWKSIAFQAYHLIYFKKVLDIYSLSSIPLSSLDYLVNYCAKLELEATLSYEERKSRLSNRISTIQITTALSNIWPIKFNMNTFDEKNSMAIVERYKAHVPNAPYNMPEYVMLYLNIDGAFEQNWISTLKAQQYLLSRITTPELNYSSLRDSICASMLIDLCIGDSELDIATDELNLSVEVNRYLTHLYDEHKIATQQSEPSLPSLPENLKIRIQATLILHKELHSINNIDHWSLTQCRNLIDDYKKSSPSERLTATRVANLKTTLYIAVQNYEAEHASEQHHFFTPSNREKIERLQFMEKVTETTALAELKFIIFNYLNQFAQQSLSPRGFPVYLLHTLLQTPSTHPLNEESSATTYHDCLEKLNQIYQMNSQRPLSL